MASPVKDRRAIVADILRIEQEQAKRAFLLSNSIVLQEYAAARETTPDEMKRLLVMNLEANHERLAALSELVKTAPVADPSGIVFKECEEPVDALYAEIGE